jgi:hypothetical protein
MWLVIALLVGFAVDAVPLLAGFDDSWWAFPAGLALLIICAYLVIGDIALVESDRKRWTMLWERHQRGETELPDTSGPSTA